MLGGIRKRLLDKVVERLSLPIATKLREDRVVEMPGCLVLVVELRKVFRFAIEACLVDVEGPLELLEVSSSQ